MCDSGKTDKKKSEIMHEAFVQSGINDKYFGHVAHLVLLQRVHAEFYIYFSLCPTSCLFYLTVRYVFPIFWLHYMDTWAQLNLLSPVPPPPTGTELIGTLKASVSW